jgi:hypothetical protein
MFVGMYLEGGWIYIITIVFILSWIHFIAMSKYLTKQREKDLLILIIFYCLIILGVIRSPIGHPTVISLIIFTLFKQKINQVVKSFLEPLIRQKSV